MLYGDAPHKLPLGSLQQVRIANLAYREMAGEMGST
jgi:hypothetical protein